MTAVALGVDLGGTRCRGGLVDSVGGLKLRAEMPTPASDDFLERFLFFCDDLLLRGRQQGLTPTCVGVGVPGVVNLAGGVVQAPNLPQLDGVGLAALLQDHFGLPVSVVNDVDAITAGELFCGAGYDLEHFLLLALGTGVGGGLVLDRKVWYGARGSTVELGHVVAVPDGRPCGCGHRGCLEAYASGLGLARSVQLALEAGESTTLADEGPALTGAAVAAAARDGDAVALAAFAEAGAHLGRVLAGVVNLLGIETVLFAGSVACSFELLRPTLERACGDAVFPGTSLPQWRLAALGADAGIIGAALAATVLQ